MLIKQNKNDYWGYYLSKSELKPSMLSSTFHFDLHIEYDGNMSSDIITMLRVHTQQTRDSWIRF